MKRLLLVVPLFALLANSAWALDPEQRPPGPKGQYDVPVMPGKKAVVKVAHHYPRPETTQPESAVSIYDGSKRVGDVNSKVKTGTWESKVNDTKEVIVYTVIGWYKPYPNESQTWSVVDAFDYPSQGNPVLKLDCFWDHRLNGNRVAFWNLSHVEVYIE